jgi:hypothetical protein
MRNLQRRIERLERPVSAGTQAWLQLILMQGGATFAFDLDQCVEVLAQRGFLRTWPCISMLNSLDVPYGLSAKELERYLGEHGAEICNLKGRSAAMLGRS